MWHKPPLAVIVCYRAFIFNKMRPKRTEDKYWTETRNFNHIQYESDLEDYITDIENKDIKDCVCQFNVSNKRVVKVISGDKIFTGEVTGIKWDFDHWIFFIDGNWYCQSELNAL